VDKLKEYIKTLVRELLDEESTTAGVPGYLTPNAFSKKGQKSNGAIEAAKSQGMKLVKKLTMNENTDFKVGDKVKYENQEWEIVSFLNNGNVRLKNLKGLPSTNVMPDKIIKINMSETIQKIIEQELLNEATYKQFKSEVKHRTKAEQLHKAMREVKRKINEIDRIVDYTQRMKQELSEGDGVAYWGRTEKAVAQIAEMVNHLTNKINNLKQ
jgi:hypothetical protein